VYLCALKSAGFASHLRMSATRQAVMPADSRTGAGKIPSRHLRQRVAAENGTMLIKFRARINAASGKCSKVWADFGFFMATLRGIQ